MSAGSAELCSTARSGARNVGAADAVDLHQTMGVRCDVAARSCERPILPLAP